MQSDSSYWLHELSYSSLESNDSGYTQQPWLPDDLCGHCMLCQQRFHLWRWTHHCRDCGGCVGDLKFLSSPALLLMSRRPTLSCSLFVRPFSLFCRECSSHRVANEGLGPPTLRICDRCAFSAAHPEHLGCERPFACPRCSAPRNVAQLVIYLQLGLRLLACCALCNPWHWSSASAKPLAAATALSTGAGGSADHAATP